MGPFFQYIQVIRQIVDALDDVRGPKLHVVRQAHQRGPMNQFYATYYRTVMTTKVAQCDGLDGYSRQ